MNNVFLLLLMNWFSNLKLFFVNEGLVYNYLKYLKIKKNIENCSILNNNSILISHAYIKFYHILFYSFKDMSYINLRNLRLRDFNLLRRSHGAKVYLTDLYGRA